MKIFVKETFDTPGYPEFKASEVYEVDPLLGNVFIDRGLAVETTGTDKHKKELSQVIKGKPTKQ